MTRLPPTLAGAKINLRERVFRFNRLRAPLSQRVIAIARNQLQAVKLGICSVAVTLVLTGGEMHALY
jgi:hypothetical protein